MVRMWVSPRPPGVHLQLRSFVLRDQHDKLTGFSGGTRGHTHTFIKRKIIMKQENSVKETEKPPLTAHVETRTGQDVSVSSMTHQVVSRLLLRAVQVVKGDGQGVRAQHAVGAAGQAQPVQGPVQSAGVEAELGAQRAGGCQAGADTQDRILRGDHCHV